MIAVGNTAANTANNDAPFMIEGNYSCRSLLLLRENLSFEGSQKQCVVRRNVMHKHAPSISEVQTWNQ